MFVFVRLGVRFSYLEIQMSINKKKSSRHRIHGERRGQQPVREAVSYRGLFTARWFGVREKHCFRLKIYDRLRANE